MPPLEDVYGSCVMPMGSSLDFTAPESLQVTISHTSVTGEVHYHLQAVPSDCSIPRTAGTLFQDQGTLSNHNASLNSGIPLSRTDWSEYQY